MFLSLKPSTFDTSEKSHSQTIKQQMNLIIATREGQRDRGGEIYLTIK